MEFRWDDWHRERATQHGVPEAEAEHVVRFARRPYPQRHGRGKWYVMGRGAGHRFVQVVYALEPDDVVYIIHAMPLGGRRRKRRN